MEKIFITQAEAAQLLGVNPKTMSKIIHAEGFKYTRIGRKILINKDFLIEYMLNHQILRN